MAAGAGLTSKSIAPGSTEYGERQTLEQGLSATMGAGGAAAPGPASPAAFPNPGNPLGALMSGAVGGGNDPVTAGLSVGPGAGPVSEDPMLGERAHRLRVLATEAASPALRALARSELRAMARRKL